MVPLEATLHSWMCTLVRLPAHLQVLLTATGVALFSRSENTLARFQVCEKVESKGRTTYNEVADELVKDFSNPDIMGAPPAGLPGHEQAAYSCISQSGESRSKHHEHLFGHVRTRRIKTNSISTPIFSPP